MAKTLLSAVVLGTGAGCQTHVPALRGAGFDVAALAEALPRQTPATPALSMEQIETIMATI